MTKIWKKDYYEKLILGNKPITTEDLWSREQRYLDSDNQTSSAYTAKEKNMETLAAILNFWRDNDFKPPTRRELAEALPNAEGQPGSFGKAHARLKSLLDAGLIDIDDDNSEIIIREDILKTLLHREEGDNDAA